MKTSFPYQQWDSVSLPMIPVSIDRVGTLYAIVDSGANVSLFQYEVAELLGIKLMQGRKIPLSGIGGKISGYLHTIRLEVGGHLFSCQVCFSKELRVPLNLLGRQENTGKLPLSGRCIH